MSKEEQEKEIVKHNIEYIKGLIVQDKSKTLIIDEIEKILEVISYNTSAQKYTLWKIYLSLEQRSKNLINAAVALNKAKKAIFIDDDKFEEQKLFNKAEEYLEIGKWTIDLRASIEQNEKNKNMKKEVFVTYSWDSEEHKEEVLSFTNFLRENGFDATLDRKISQEETAPDFTKMMHQAMTDYDKVIVVLTEKYKEKADTFSGGVGTEYNLIINDISNHPRKYVLVSFNGISDSILPLAFKGREVIDISTKEKQTTLFAKLQNKDEIEFAPVAAAKPEIVARAIPTFRSEQKNELVLTNVSTVFKGGLQQAMKYKYIEYSFKLTIQNNSSKPVTEFNVEVSLPKDLTNFNSKGRIKDGIKYYSFNNTEKLYPNQETEIEIGNLYVTNKFAELAFASELKIRIYTDEGVMEENNLIQKYLTDTSGGAYRTRQLAITHFHDKHVN